MKRPPVTRAQRKARKAAHRKRNAWMEHNARRRELSLPPWLLRLYYGL
jgi:hypothetical protein